MNRIFVDMDGVIVDFNGYVESKGYNPELFKKVRGAYASLKPMPGAMEAMKALPKFGYKVFIATKPPTGIAWAYQDKAQWVFTHLPAYTKKLILTPDKGLLGDKGDYLIDDHPEWANCKNFQGQVLKFSDWQTLMGFFATVPLNFKEE